MPIDNFHHQSWCMVHAPYCTVYLLHAPPKTSTIYTNIQPVLSCSQCFRMFTLKHSVQIVATKVNLCWKAFCKIFLCGHTPRPDKEHALQAECACIYQPSSCIIQFSIVFVYLLLCKTSERVYKHRIIQGMRNISSV